MPCASRSLLVRSVTANDSVTALFDGKKVAIWLEMDWEVEALLLSENLASLRLNTGSAMMAKSLVARRRLGTSRRISAKTEAEGRLTISWLTTSGSEKVRGWGEAAAERVIVPPPVPLSPRPHVS